MDGLTGLFAVMIPIVAIGGAFAYAAYERWQEGEEKKQALTSAAGGEETQRRVQRIEEDMTLLRTELSDDMRDVKEQLARIETMLRDVG